MLVRSPGPILNTNRASLFTERFTMMDRLLHLDRLRDLYQEASQDCDDYSFHRNLLAALQVTLEVDPADLRRIPATGPLVVVANHPFGMLEGSLLNSCLPQIRTDYKIVTNRLLASLPELEKHCIFVDPFENHHSKLRNSKALRQAIEWLRAGHMLVMFPAGEVSSWNFKHGEVEDSEWSSTVARLIRIARSPAIPVFFKGANSIPFHVLGMMHPRLRTARLPHELLNKRGKSIQIRVGSVLPFDTLQGFPDEQQVTSYLRWRTYLLGNRGETREKSAPRAIRASIAAEVSGAAVAQDLASLGPDQLLEDTREFSVYLANAPEIPNVLNEIGRLREITFRLVGEGTGNATDLDKFDPYYQHLVLWSKVNQEIAGAYRLADAGRILSRYGTNGLYTSTLFHYSPRFFDEIGPAFELGRSFVRLEYQKKYSPLLLLWKGLARHIARNPQIPVLFGAVSISNDYHPVSRQLCALFLQTHQANSGIAALVRARRPFRSAKRRACDDEMMRSFFQDLESLSSVVADVEADGKGIPILLKQYLKLGGRLLGFNIDARFSDSLDGLVLVDLRKTEPAILDRYMGKGAAAQFLKNTTVARVALSAIA